MFLSPKVFPIIPVLAFSAIALIIILAVVFNRKNMVLRKLAKFKHKRVSQFRNDEPTKVTGKVLEVATPFIAPFSKRPCVAYIFEVKQKVSTGKSSHWKTLVKKEDIQDFFIEQKGELVMVKPSMRANNFYSYMVEDQSVKSGVFNSPTPEFKEVLNDLGVTSETWLGFNKTLKYTERIIEIGETITVGGIAKWKAVTEPINGHNYSKIAALESGPNQKLIFTDYPKAVTPLYRGV
ncbi:hypothetical protein [Aestuariivivens insulae]|uniref:hypothetical protein n=1 Tax=Aestuariivivens insulae TaxID=1621988 RepID=UPI001F57B448|nr:hypothetical protein [Aestuariivivens insulae]